MTDKTITTCDKCGAQTFFHLHVNFSHHMTSGSRLDADERKKWGRLFDVHNVDLCSRECVAAWLLDRLTP